MINPSRLYNFLDRDNGFSVYFLEGQSIIHDMALRHQYNPDGFKFNRDTLLSSLHIINYLKPGEQIGYYIDSVEPDFRFKLETNSQGNYRTLLMPENIEKFPKNVTGLVRTSKFISGKQPYNSIVELKSEPSENVTNKMLEESYQLKNKILLSASSDQSVMISKLPPQQIDKEVIDDISIQEYLLKQQAKFHLIMDKALNDVESIVKDFEQTGVYYLGSKQVEFTCSCSKENMMFNLGNLNQNDQDHIFELDPLHIKCDYCQTNYEISKADFIKFIEKDLQ